MELATIELDTSCAGRSAAGLVIAGLRLDLGGTLFPAPTWTDFAVVVLSWWAVALTAVVRGDSRVQEVRFMEGPYLVRIQSGEPGGGLWRVELIEAGLRRRVWRTGDVKGDLLVQSVLEAGDGALRLCRERGWWSSDADELASALVALRELE